MKLRLLGGATLALVIGAALTLGVNTSAFAADRTINISGFGVKTGIFRIFGLNTEAVLNAAANHINNNGGIKLADGATGKIKISFYDDRCKAEEGISVVRRIAGTSALIAVGPTCSNVAEPLFGILQKKRGDASDSGLQMPIFTDTAIKGGLAKISDWAFRNVPSEDMMYEAMFKWLRTEYPDLKTLYGGVEQDFAHSRFTWHKVMKNRGPGAGYELVGEAQWLLSDTNFTTQVRGMKKKKPDIIAISSHPFTTCGLLRELKRQRVKPKIIVGLTSSSSMETLTGCAKEAEGIIIPTSFAPVNKEARYAASEAAKLGGAMDLHSAAAWENIMVIADVIEKSGALGKPDTVQADRGKIRDELASRKTTKGLLGTIGRTAEGEAEKPFVYAVARGGQWEVLHDPS